MASPWKYCMACRTILETGVLIGVVQNSSQTKQKVKLYIRCYARDVDILGW